MGIKERRLAQKEALKKDILLATRTIFRQEGNWHEVTIRKIAASINYSLPTIYEYFKNKYDLLRAMQQEGYSILCTMLKTNLLAINGANAFAYLTTIAQTYWDFAWEHPELYYTMNNQKNSMQDHQEAIIFIRSMVQQALQNMDSEKRICDQQIVDNKIECMRGIIHGFIMLSLAESMEKQRAHTLMMQTLHDYIYQGL
jgi:AcrR family transcriptional regulator